MKTLFQIRNTYILNKILYTCKQAPFFRYFFDGDLIHDEDFRKHALIPFLIIKYSLKILLMFIFLGIPFFIFPERNISLVLLYFIFYSFLIYNNIPLIKWNSLTNVCINFFHIDPSEYVYQTFQIKFLETIITSCLATSLLNIFFDISYWILFILIIIQLFTRTILQYRDYSKKSKQKYIANKFYRLGLTSILLTLLTFYFASLSQNTLFQFLLSIIMIAILLLLGFNALLELVYNLDFKELSKKYLTKEMIKSEDTSMFELIMTTNLANNKSFDKTKSNSNQKGIYYIHDLFQERFSSEIKGRAKYIRNILFAFILICFVFCILKNCFQLSIPLFQDVPDINIISLLAICITCFSNGCSKYLEYCNVNLDFKLSKHNWFYKEENRKILFQLREEEIKKLNKINNILTVILFLLLYFWLFQEYSWIEISYLIFLIIGFDFLINNLFLILYYHLKLDQQDLKIMNKFQNGFGFIILCFALISHFLSIPIIIKIMFLAIMIFLSYLLKRKEMNQFEQVDL